MKIIKNEAKSVELILSTDQESFTNKMHQFIDSDYDESDNESLKKQLQFNDKNYFGRIGENFFVASIKRKLGYIETKHGCKIKCEFSADNNETRVSINFSMKKKDYNSMIFVCFSLLILSIIGICSAQDLSSVLVYIFSSLIGTVLIILYYNQAFIKSRKKFIIDFSNFIGLK